MSTSSLENSSSTGDKLNWKWILGGVVILLLGCSSSMYFERFIKKKVPPIVKPPKAPPTIQDLMVGTWEMPSVIAMIEPLKPSRITITQPTKGKLVLTQGTHSVDLIPSDYDKERFVPVAPNTLWITYSYERWEKRLMQFFYGHPFYYTRIS
jgi:hypothetical protein